MALEQPALIESPFNSRSNPFAADTPDIAAIPSEKDYRTIGWCEDALQEGSAFLQAQEGYDRIERSVKTIIGDGVGMSGIGSRSPMSQTRTNRIAKVAEDVAAILTDTKPFWEYQTANRRFEQHSTIYGKLATSWYQNHNIAMRLSDVIKYSLACGTGFAHLVWNPTISDIDFVAEDPRNVIPVRPNGFDTCQNALGMIVKKWYSVNYFKQRYGIDVKPESDGSAAQAQSPTSGSGGIMGYLRGATGMTKPPKFPVAALKIMYLTDTRPNPKQAPVAMGSFKNGQETNNWSYIVQPGDALYPNKRMIVWVGQHLIYDGPSHYWHGQFPLIKFTLSPWPWSWLGKGAIWDLLPLGDSLNSTLRIIDDHLAQVRNPGAIMDKNSVSRSQYESFDSSRPGWKAYQNPLAGKGIQVINPPQLDAMAVGHRDWCEKEIRELGGVNDFSQMMKLNQLPSNDTVDSILGSMTPMNRYRSRIIEAFVGGSDGLAMQLAYNFSQYYTLPMRCQILGAGGVCIEDFDYDPKSLIPAYPHDNDVDSTGGTLATALARGPLPRYERAQEFMKRFTFKIAPSSFLNSAQVQDQMMKFQLFRAGVLDIWTLMEALGIPNMGVLPDNVRTIPERIAYQNQIGLVPNVSSTGRKASGQEAPRQVIKES